MRSSLAESAPLVGLPPIVDERSRVLVLGSFPSVKSLEKQEYYAHPQNHFWQIMGALFDFDAKALYEQRVLALQANGVAVWDVIAECSREGSGDDAIMEVEANPIPRLLREYPGIRRIGFNGGTAFGTARSHLPDLFEMPDVVCERLPSTSPRHARMTLDAKIEAWSAIKYWTRGHG